MQAISGLTTSLGCTDCKANFTSASSLLKHFAEHISNNGTREGSAESESEDTRSESILERALRSPASGSSTSPREACSPAEVTSQEDEKKSLFKEEKKTVTLSKSGSKIPDLLELAKGTNNNKHVMYVKLDLQKRVENCVLQLRGSNSESTDDETRKLEITEEEEEEEEEEDDYNDEVGDTNPETEEFNPLKFCVVTLEEGNEKLELSDVPSGKPPIITNNNNNNISDPQQQFKKYLCTYCLKRFGWSTDLKRHILTHTGERPFQCKLCGATFTRNFLLQKHVLKLHSGGATQVSPLPPKPPIEDGIIKELPTKSKDSSYLRKRRRLLHGLADRRKP